MWKRRLGWVALMGMIALVGIALTARFWFVPAVRLVLATRGIHIDKISSPTNGVWRFEGVDAKRNGMEFKAGSVTAFKPRAWKRALRNANTNDVFLRVDLWRLTLPEARIQQTNSIFGSLKQLEEQALMLKAKCPRAQFLNGVIVRNGGEFRSGVLEWKNGELAGDITWPGLNDPGDLHLKFTDTNKTQFILKQFALDLAAKITAQTETNTARVFGYARWKENKADFDFVFGPTNNAPLGGFLKSDGLQLPREVVRIPGVEQLNARVRLVVTNGLFNLKLGAPASTSAAPQEGG